MKGGAYGAGFQVTRAGSMRFYTYRDPRIDESIGRMAAAGRWIESFAPDEAEMEGFVVSAVAGLDAPLKARDLVRRQDGMYFGSTPPSSGAKLRVQVVEAQAQDIRALGPLVERVVDSGCVCVVGGRKLIDSMEEDLHVVDLFGVAPARRPIARNVRRSGSASETASRISRRGAGIIINLRYHALGEVAKRVRGKEVHPYRRDG